MVAVLQLECCGSATPIGGAEIQGVARVDVPLRGCRILTDTILVVPFAIREGVASTLFLPDGLPPGLRLTAQGATLGAEFRTSNGLELVCR